MYTFQLVGNKTCLIYNQDEEYIGKVHIDETGAWTPSYANGVRYLPINEALGMLRHPPCDPIFTHGKLSKGRIFSFYADWKTVYNCDDEIDLWYERERGGLGEKIVYGKARVYKTPVNPNGMYEAIVL